MVGDKVMLIMIKYPIILLTILFIFNRPVFGLEINQHTKTEILKTSKECFVWKDQKDLLLEKKFNFDNKYEITTFLCGEKDEAFGWLAPDGPSANVIISTNSIHNNNDCINPFFAWSLWKDEKSYIFFYIKDLIKKQELIICSWSQEDGYFVVDQEITKDEQFLEIKFKGSFNENHIYLLQDFSIEPIIIKYSKSRYSIKSKLEENELKVGEEFNLSPVLEKHFNIELIKDIIFIPFI